jgi:4-coumarate--CoA ligase
LIKVRGMQVAPAELEGVLLDHPNIADVGVIGVPLYVFLILFRFPGLTTFSAGDERPRAYVVPVANSGLTEDDVTRWVSERCTEYKWITGGVKFVAEIPKNPSGKILRRDLRVRAAKEVVDTGNFKAKL